jgi:hypothetical protein
MNILIILSFLVFIACIVVLIYPKQFILMIGYINTYDLDTVPFKYIRRLYLIITLLMIASLVVLYYEIGLMTYPDLNIDWDFFTSIFG